MHNNLWYFYPEGETSDGAWSYYRTQCVLKNGDLCWKCKNINKFKPWRRCFQLIFRLLKLVITHINTNPHLWWAAPVYWVTWHRQTRAKVPVPITRSISSLSKDNSQASDKISSSTSSFSIWNNHQIHSEIRQRTYIYNNFNVSFTFLWEIMLTYQIETLVKMIILPQSTKKLSRKALTWQSWRLIVIKWIWKDGKCLIFYSLWKNLQSIHHFSLQMDFLKVFFPNEWVERSVAGRSTKVI